MKLWIIVVLGVIIAGCTQKQTDVNSSVTNNRAEIETKVTAVRVERECPVCNEGTMEITDGWVLTVYPALYPHKCTKCGHEEHYSGVQYPYIKHK